MADQKCPMCGKPNPQTASTCIYCNARLTPMQAGSPGKKGTSSLAGDWMADLRGDIMKNRPKTGLLPPEPEAPTDSGDWLKKMTGEIPAKQKPSTPPSPMATAGKDDWRSSALPEESSSPATPPAKQVAPAPEVPAWLSKVREQVTTGSLRRENPPPVHEPPKTAPAIPPKMKPQPQAAPEQPQKDEEPSWLKRIRTRKVQEDVSSAPATPAPVSAPSQEAEPSNALPDWLSKIKEQGPESEPGVDASYLSAPIPTPVPQPSTGFVPPMGSGFNQSDQIASQDSDVPDWLKQATSGGTTSSGAGSAFSSDLANWQNDGSAPAAPDIFSGGAPASSGLTPDWGAGVPQTGWDFPAAAPDLPFEGVSYGTPTTPSAFAAGMEPMVAPGGEEIPDWLAGVKEEAQANAAVAEPAEEEPPVPTPDLSELLHPGTLPEWMTKQIEPDKKKTEQAEQAPEAAASAPSQDGLEQVELPRWLEAMRPIEAVAVAEEQDEHVESVGPLAGLRGVISAEPVVAMPRRPQVLVGNIDTTPVQSTKADLLQRIIIEPELRQIRKPPKTSFVVTLSRRIIAAALVLAAILPFFGWNIFPEPVYSEESPLLVNARDAINALPADKPVLVAFDFDASSAPELRSGAIAVLTHLQQKALPLVVFSTDPVGPTLAETILKNEKGEPMAGYINLGYLPGEAAGLRKMAAGFTDAFTVPPVEPFSRIQSIGDFSMFLVITAQPQDVKNWVEQVHTKTAMIPIVVVTSAAVDVLVFPYTRGKPAAIAGVVSGYAGAEAYAANFLQGSTLNAATAERWQAFSMGNLFAILILFAGTLASILALILKRPKGKKE